MQVGIDLYERKGGVYPSTRAYVGKQPQDGKELATLDCVGLCELGRKEFQGSVYSRGWEVRVTATEERARLTNAYGGELEEVVGAGLESGVWVSVVIDDELRE